MSFYVQGCTCVSTFPPSLVRPRLIYRASVYALPFVQFVPRFRVVGAFRFWKKFLGKWWSTWHRTRLSPSSRSSCRDNPRRAKVRNTGVSAQSNKDTPNTLPRWELHITKGVGLSGLSLLVRGIAYDYSELRRRITNRRL